ncbi:MAG: sulfotransferase [Actinomycetota bacterium]
MLPNFLIIGAPKAGTTALAASLAAHPQVYVAPEKEVHFFDDQWARGLDWYAERFAGAREERALGEASPTYMYVDPALERIAETVPAAKLIVCLRNPIDRAYSHYWWMRALFEEHTFEDTVRRELAGETREMGVRPYVRSGEYLTRLKRIREILPASPLHVMILEDLRTDPEPTYAAVCRFLEVDDTEAPGDLSEIRNPAYRLRFPWLRKAMFRFHARRRLGATLVDRIDLWNRVPFRYPSMDPATRATLERHYARPNADLAAWLGRDLSAWQPATSPEPTASPERP